MADPDPQTSGEGRAELEAAEWILRCDRGLTPTEQDEFSAWLAADPAHGAQLARHRRHWRRLDTLSEWRPEHAARPNPDLLAPKHGGGTRRWITVGALAAAAAVAVGIYGFRSAAGGGRDDTAKVAAANPVRPDERVLPDGSRVEMNQGAEFSVEFTATERRIRFVRGEAHFFVQKNPERPFIVSAAGIDVRAVGTAFNVRIDPKALEVLVTEGKVRVDSAAGENGMAKGAARAAPAAPLIPVLEARQRAVVPLAPATAVASVPQAALPEPQIATLTPREIERVLAWQHRLLDFNATPISEIVAEFNRRNVTQLAVLDPELAATRMSATLRSDNIDGFVRLLEAGFGVRAEKRGEGEILLSRGK